MSDKKQSQKKSEVGKAKVKGEKENVEDLTPKKDPKGGFFGHSQGGLTGPLTGVLDGNSTGDAGLDT